MQATTKVLIHKSCAWQFLSELIFQEFHLGTVKHVNICILQKLQLWDFELFAINTDDLFEI